MTRLPWFACLAAVVACYSPTTEAPCTVTCDFAGDKLCPDGLTCGSGGMCGLAESTCAPCVGQPDGLLRVCLADPPVATYEVTGSDRVVNTSPGSAAECISYPQPGAGAPDVCLIAAQNILIHGKLTVVGSRPLVLLATDLLTIEETGSVDAAALQTRVGVTAPGSVETCPEGGAPQGNGNGGPGGSFGSFGGNGGLSSGSPTPAGAVVGLLDHVRAGCPGAPGQNSTAPPAGAGGAVYLMAGMAIVLDGSVNASGAGGGPPRAPDAGGTGGGTGGLIGIDSPSSTIAGTLMANGGGGSCGNLNEADIECPGDDPAFGSDTFVPAAGGVATGHDGDGGAGATDSPGMPGMSSGSNRIGGGGGGGGAGIIWFAGSAPQVPGRVSPAPFAH